MRGHRRPERLRERVSCVLSSAQPGWTAAGLNPGDRIQAKFRLPALPDELDVAATVCNKTPASEGHTIMGLHFPPAPEAAETLAVLREALAGPQTATVTEVCV